MRIPHALVLAAASTLVAFVSTAPVADPPQQAAPRVSVEDVFAGGTPVPQAVFELSGGGALFHLEGGASPGSKAFKTKANKKNIAQCIAGDLGCGGHMDALEINDVDMKAYLYIYDANTWGITTTADPANTVVPAEGDPVPVTLLTGLMDGKGRFMMAGRHAASETDFLFEGKAALEKGTLVPKKASGTLSAVSIEAEHWFNGKAKTVGKTLFTPDM